MEKQALAPGIFTIGGVLTADECREMIALAERQGFDEATINALDGPRLDKEMRNNDRVIIDDSISRGESGVEYGSSYLAHSSARPCAVSTSVSGSIDTLPASDSPGTSTAPSSGRTAKGAC